MAVRLSDAEKKTVEARISLAWSRCQTASLGVVAHELKGQRMTDNSGMSSNGNLVIGIVRSGILKTVMLRRASQEVSKATLDTRSVKWVGVEKRATGGKARRSEDNTEDTEQPEPFWENIIPTDCYSFVDFSYHVIVHEHSHTNTPTYLIPEPRFTD